MDDSLSANRPLKLFAGQRDSVKYPNSLPGGSMDGTPSDSREQVSVAGLRNRRAFKELSQSELARRSGVTQAQISQSERSGTTTRRSASMLAKALGSSVEDLANSEQHSRFGRTGSPVVTVGEQGSMQPGVDSASHDSQEKQRAPLTLNIPEPVLQRVDRLLDILEKVTGPRGA